MLRVHMVSAFSSFSKRTVLDGERTDLIGVYTFSTLGQVLFSELEDFITEMSSL